MKNYRVTQLRTVKLSYCRSSVGRKGNSTFNFDPREEKKKNRIKGLSLAETAYCKSIMLLCNLLKFDLPLNHKK